MNTPTEEAKEAERERVEKPLTREQRRHVERVEKEALQVLNQLQDQFLKSVLDSNDPEGEAMIERADQISAKWKVYCHRKGLLPSAHQMIYDFCIDDVLNDYSANKNSGKADDPIGIERDQLKAELDERKQKDAEDMSYHGHPTTHSVKP
jgi:hypothetical protein